MTDEAFEHLLANWVRWHSRRLHPGRCGSLEGGYSAKGVRDAPPITPLGQVDQLAAQLVEDAWKTLPFTPKMLIKWHYVIRRSPGAICRSLRQRPASQGVERITLQGYADALLRAKGLLNQAIADYVKGAHHARIAVVRVSAPDREAAASIE